MTLLPRETAFSACDQHFQGKFPVVNSHGYVKRSEEAPTKFNVLRWQGDLRPEVQEPIKMLMKLVAS